MLFTIFNLQFDALANFVRYVQKKDKREQAREGEREKGRPQKNRKLGKEMRMRIVYHFLLQSEKLMPIMLLFVFTLSVLEFRFCCIRVQFALRLPSYDALVRYAQQWRLSI